MNLSSQKFWDHFYEQKSRDEWYFPQKISEDFIHSYLRNKSLPQSTLLNCGCGTALWPLRCSLAGTVTVNFDYSAPSLLSGDPVQAEALVADGLSMPFVSSSFDVIVEKGLFDSVTSVKSESNARKLLSEYRRCIRPTGLLFIFSIFGPNAEQKDMFGLLNHEGFTVECRDLFITPAEIPSQDFCHVYILSPQ
jgi:SAM-dependent methyltransferase